MDEKRLIWVSLVGTSLLTVYRSLRDKTDPTPQLAGIGATGFFLLLGGEVAPKLASGFAVLFSIAYAYGTLSDPVLPENTFSPEKARILGTRRNN